VALIEISEVGSEKERDAFIKFPWRVYRDDPAWVPPLLIERKEFLDRKRHPFYRHGDAALFLARKNGEIVGRIMASDDPNYNALHQSNVGCFGLFECINDREIAAALLVAATDWLRKRGRTEIMGPIDYSTNYVCGLLIDGFEHAPVLLTAHNPRYYTDLIESCGFEKVKDWYAWWWPYRSRELVERLRKIADALARRHNQSFTIRPINMRKYAEDSSRIRAVYNQAWKKNWGFVPFTEAESEYMAKEMKYLAVPDMVLLAEDGDRPVGFVIGVPDLNQALRHIDGRLTRFGLPIGLIKLLYYRTKIRAGRLVALGVVEKYRRLGVAETLVLRVMDEALKRKLDAELSMTLEDNTMINRFIEAVGGSRYKTYRIYRRPIEKRAGA
jgi:GNAT superfamily N-acetyltransferase